MHTKMHPTKTCKLCGGPIKVRNVYRGGELLGTLEGSCPHTQCTMRRLVKGGRDVRVITVAEAREALGYLPREFSGLGPHDKLEVYDAEEHVL